MKSGAGAIFFIGGTMETLLTGLSYFIKPTSVSFCFYMAVLLFLMAIYAEIGER
jgi:hypothetical protein